MTLTLGETIKLLRKRNKLTQEALAEKLKVTPRAVYVWETDKKLPSLDNIINLSIELNISIDDLCKYEKEKRESNRPK